MTAAPRPGTLPTAAAVGAAVRDTRRDRGWSLSELARRSGVGKATLSQLEAGRRNPTLETLFALTTALSVPLGTVLDRAGATGGTPAASGAAVDASLLEIHRSPGVTVEVYRLTIRRTVQVSRPHATGVTETLTLTHGSARVGRADAPAVLAPGQTHVFPGDTPHTYEGLAEETGGVLVMTYR